MIIVFLVTQFKLSKFRIQYGDCLLLMTLSESLWSCEVLFYVSFWFPFLLQTWSRIVLWVVARVSRIQVVGYLFTGKRILFWLSSASLSYEICGQFFKGALLKLIFKKKILNIVVQHNSVNKLFDMLYLFFVLYTYYKLGFSLC